MACDDGGGRTNRKDLDQSPKTLIFLYPIVNTSILWEDQEV